MGEFKKNSTITPIEESMSQWYSDVCLKAELMDYSRTKGFIIYRPYGFAIWENIKNWLDKEFKKTGIQNVYMPSLIPESLFNLEKEHVEGFAPECAIVTTGGNKELDEKLIIRPTSETLFCDHFKNVLNSYRDLPLLYNQWCNVVRWEKTTRPFLRGKEFLWQEGHTVHETEKEAREETLKMLEIYRSMGENLFAFPFVCGRKTEKEKFAGAVETYTIEALMPDGQALQSGTSHYFGQGFCEKFGVKFLGKDNKIEYPYQTSFGVSTRLIGSIIMMHGDDNGLVLPPAIAPIQVVIVTVKDEKVPELKDYARGLKAKLEEMGVRVKYDETDRTPGWKYAEYEMKGVPVRVSVGPRDRENGVLEVVYRYNGEKVSIPEEEFINSIHDIFKTIHQGMYNKAQKYLNEHIYEVHTYDELKDVLSNGRGYAKMMWDGTREVEDKIKEEFNASSRCMPFDQTPFGDVDPVSGRKAKYVCLFARSY
ncbi:MAG TPA: proline--tRNA ligase [Firmicutes bacterium]|nr:proline--tRNA ligase [Bacillota bacterium]